jgi:hypothetical protein
LFELLLLDDELLEPFEHAANDNAARTAVLPKAIFFQNFMTFSS